MKRPLLAIFNRNYRKTSKRAPSLPILETPGSRVGIRFGIRIIRNRDLRLGTGTCKSRRTGSGSLSSLVEGFSSIILGIFGTGLDFLGQVAPNRWKTTLG